MASPKHTDGSLRLARMSPVHNIPPCPHKMPSGDSVVSIRLEARKYSSASPCIVCLPLGLHRTGTTCPNGCRRPPPTILQKQHGNVLSMIYPWFCIHDRDSWTPLAIGVAAICPCRNRYVQHSPHAVPCSNYAPGAQRICKHVTFNMLMPCMWVAHTLTRQPASQPVCQPANSMHVDYPKSIIRLYNVATTQYCFLISALPEWRHSNMVKTT